MRRSFTFLFASGLFTAQAQPFSWQWSQWAASTSSIPDPQGFATDPLGNSYVTGQFYGTVGFGLLPPLTSLGESDVFVVKYDNQGVALWAVRAGGMAVES